jgi:putative DNA primase/helicase
MTLQEFYADRFNSDPYALLYDGCDDLEQLAQSAGIVWKSCADDIQLNPKGSEEKFSRYAAPRKVKATVDELKGRVEVYSRLNEYVSKDGKTRIQCPFVNFIRKGSDAGSWNGYQHLWSEYNRFREQTGLKSIVTERDLQRQERMAAARRERERQQLIQAHQASQVREEALLGYLDFHRAFDAAPRDDGTWPYAIRKQIRDVSRSVNLRVVTRHESSRWDAKPNKYWAIPLSHLDGRYNGRIVGWQRITAEGGKNGKFQTKAVEGGEFSGSCFVIGDLNHAQDVAVVEGFATGASVWMACQNDPNKRFDAVVVAISANNLIHVVEQLVNCYPAAKITCALDNDRKSAAEEKGNTGLRVGYDVLEKFPSVKCVYPTFEDDPEMKCSDFNDLHTLRGLKEVAKQLSRNVLARRKDLLSITLNKLKTLPRINRRKFAKELLQAVDVGMLTCPVPNSPKELFRTICATLREMGIEDVYKRSVSDHIARKLNRKCRVAQSPRSFSERITDPNIRPSHITYKKFDTPRVTKDVYDYVQSLNGLVIMRAGMGSGKSKEILRPLMHAAERGVSIAHRVSLIGGLHEMMTAGHGASADILHYQDPGYKEMAPYSKKLTICINSIVKGCWQTLMKQHDFLGLDEATQGLRAILAGRAMENPVGVFNTLIDAFARTEQHAIMVDADANDLLIDLAELAMKRREELGLPAWLQIHVIELPVDVKNRETNEPIRVFYTEKDRIITDVLSSVEKGEKIMLATDSSSFAEDVTCQLKLRYPAKKFLLVNQKSKPDQEVEEFTNNPQKLVRKYDGLIYSPSISSGVSFEKPHFDRHFGMFCGEVVPSDAIQMLRRDRTAQEFIIGFDRNRGRRETDPQKIMKAYAQALLETAAMNGELTDVILEDDRLSLGVANSSFMRLKVKATAMEAVARNDYANNMVCIMHADGYTVAPLASDELANGIGKELRKEAREVVWSQTIERHLETETPTETERESLLKKRTLTLDEQAQLVRWDIEHELKLPVDEDSLKFYLDGGMKKIRTFETLQLDEVTARRFDREEMVTNFNYVFKHAGHWQYFVVAAMTREQADRIFTEKYPGITDHKVKAQPKIEAGMRSFYGLKSATLQQYFKDCGIDPVTLTGEATQATMKRARDNLLTSDRRDLLNNVLRIGGFTTPKGKPKAPAALFKNICDSIGLTTDKRRARDGDKRPTIRFVEPGSAAHILGIIEQRQEAGQTLQSRKPEKVDHGLDQYVYMDQIPRSTENTDGTGPASVIEDALTDSPVPVRWVMDVLTSDELRQLATLPMRLLRATLAGLYMTDHMGTLSVGEYDELRRLQAV